MAVLSPKAGSQTCPQVTSTVGFASGSPIGAKLTFRDTGTFWWPMGVSLGPVVLCAENWGNLSTAWNFKGKRGAHPGIARPLTGSPGLSAVSPAPSGGSVLTLQAFPLGATALGVSASGQGRTQTKLPVVYSLEGTVLAPLKYFPRPMPPSNLSLY